MPRSRWAAGSRSAPTPPLHPPTHTAPRLRRGCERGRRSGEGAGDSRSARLHSSAPMGAGSGCCGRRWKRSSLGRGLQLRGAAGRGGRLPRRGAGPGSRGEGCGCRRGARPPLLARHDCGTWCRGGGTAARHWCGNPSPSRSSRGLLLLLCGGNRCTQTESSCEQGAGRGLKGEPGVQTSAAPGGREPGGPGSRDSAAAGRSGLGPSISRCVFSSEET